MCFQAYEDTKDLDQPAHPHSLIRAFPVRQQNHWILQYVWMESKGPNDTLCMHRMIWIFTFCTCSKTLYCLVWPIYLVSLTFTTLWAFSADDKLMIFFLFFPENRIWHFMQIVSLGDNLHEMSNPVFWENKKNLPKCCLLKILPRVLSVNFYHSMGKIHQMTNWRYFSPKIVFMQNFPRAYFLEKKENYFKMLPVEIFTQHAKC